MSAGQATQLPYSSAFVSPGSNNNGAYRHPPPQLHTVVPGPGRGVNANGPPRSSPVTGPSPIQHRHGLTTQSPVGGHLVTGISPHSQRPGSSPLSTYGSSPLSMMASSIAMRGSPAGGGPRVEYNPQQWGAAGPTGGAYIPHSALAATAPTNPEDDPNPPPPYSPPHDRTSAPSPSAVAGPSSRPALPYLQTALPQRGHDYGTTPVTAVSMISPPSAFERNRPNIRAVVGPPPMDLNPSFPPPPGRDRSTSRSRFGLSALTRGISTDRSASSATPEPLIGNPVRVVSGGNEVHHGYGRVQRPANVAGNRMSVYIQPTEPMHIPPTARRSASAGPVASQVPMANSVSPIHLPPPPPGPPPSGSRATSRQRDEHVEVGNLTVPIINMPTRRPRGNAPNLETVPATPAGWTEDGQPIQMNHGPNSSSDDQSVVSSSEEERLTRRDREDGDFRLEKRDTTVKGIRERRSESRAAKDRIQDSSSDDSKPSDLTLNLGSAGISRQGAIKGRVSMSPRDTPSPAPLSRRGTLSSMSAPSSAKENGQMSNRSSADSQNHLTNLRNALSSRPGSSAGSVQDSFTKEALERHLKFVEKERFASSDRERLDLFAEYIVLESRLRRDRYADAFSAISVSDILDLTRDLWRPIQPQSAATNNGKAPLSATLNSGKAPLSATLNNGKAPLRNSSVGPRPLSSRTGSFESQDSGSSPMSSRANYTPRTEDSPTSGNIPPARENTFKNFQPVLSPIPSMAMSTLPDEDAPRGRSQSRWWESDEGSITQGGRKIERTKRESKYMGLHPDARYNLQYDDQHSPAMASTPGQAGPSNEYPPEKVGWHEDEYDRAPTPHYSVPSTPLATMGLDVSRLVTLPPPYPRHYPATDMSHPELASIRTTIRNLNELDEISEKKTAFASRISRQRAVSAQEEAARTAQMRHNISEQVRLGQMSFTSAAAAENDFHVRELASKQLALRKEYDAFAPEVMSPLTALLSERVTKASACISSLREGLDTAKAAGNHDAPMEEGDEHPELLEKLKLIKWLAEARETLQRELYLLDSERCERYRDFILADIEGKAQGGPEEARQRCAEARQFFRADQAQRWLTFEKESRTRAEELLAIVETHVSQGAQEQLSAFWDIAPGLAELLKKIPEDERGLESLRLSIPHKEIEENPSYTEYPLQYLHGLLCHAEKATYQFIENQVGLWCLLQELSLVVIRANLRVMKAERCLAEDRDEKDEELEGEMAQLATFEEQRLTSQLKDRVDTVEGQWKDGLGHVLEECVQRVESVLIETGGWDDGLRE